MWNIYVASINSITYGGSAEKWSSVAVGANNDCLDASAISYEKVQITFVAGHITTTMDIEVGEVPAYDGIPMKEHEDASKYYIFTGWSDGTNEYAAGTELPEATANVTYTAVFGSEADRYTTETIDGSSVTWTLDLRDGVLVISGEGATVSVEATGEGLTYTWYYKNPSNKKFYESGADFVDGDTYSIPMYSWRDGQ